MSARFHQQKGRHSHLICDWFAAYVYNSTREYHFLSALNCNFLNKARVIVIVIAASLSDKVRRYQDKISGISGHPCCCTIYHWFITLKLFACWLICLLMRPVTDMHRLTACIKSEKYFSFLSVSSSANSAACYRRDLHGTLCVCHDGHCDIQPWARAVHLYCSA